VSWSFGAFGWALAAVGWAVAGALIVALRRRSGLLADAEHELRGAAAVIGLAAERAARTGLTAAFASLVRLQLDRMGAALVDLAAARSLRRPAPPIDCELDAARLAQVLANLIANAAEHGTGPIEIESDAAPGSARLLIRNGERAARPGGRRGRRASGRGRGLAVVQRAADEIGARVTLDSRDGETVATVELPAGNGESGELRRAA
jgi:hypothetical protein